MALPILFYLLFRFAQVGSIQLSEANKLSGDVAHELSGLSEYRGYPGGGIHETDKTATGDPENEI